MTSHVSEPENGFEHVGGVLRSVLSEIVAGLPPTERSEALEALGAHGIHLTLHKTSSVTEPVKA